MPEGWELWRQDDNGNEFLVEIHHELESAQARLHVLESRGHKQIYWLRRRSPEAGVSGSADPPG